MNRRFICVFLAITVSSSIAACGGDDEAAAPATVTELSGVYRPAEDGPIASITFSGNQDYLMMPKGCSGGACAEIGTYHLDMASKVIVLENGTTHKKSTIALEGVKTTP